MQVRPISDRAVIHRASSVAQSPEHLGFHGNVASHGQSVRPLYAQSQNFLLLAPGSRGLTWDAISFRYGYDVAFIDSALRWTFDRFFVNPARISVAGFSDGASYSLGLGLGNGDLFSRVVAFSPGYIPRSDTQPVGRPRFFYSHGRADTALPIDTASRRIVPQLEADGYDLTYVEFEGGHEVPAAIASQAVDFLLA